MSTLDQLVQQPVFSYGVIRNFLWNDARGVSSLLRLDRSFYKHSPYLHKIRRIQYMLRRFIRWYEWSNFTIKRDARRPPLLHDDKFGPFLLVVRKPKMHVLPPYSFMQTLLKERQCNAMVLVARSADIGVRFQDAARAPTTSTKSNWSSR